MCTLQAAKAVRLRAHLKPPVAAAAGLLVLALGEGAVLHVAGAPPNGALEGMAAVRFRAEIYLFGRLLVPGFAFPLAGGRRLDCLLPRKWRSVLCMLLWVLQVWHAGGICTQQTEFVS